MKVFILAALTADGFIGRDKHHVAHWTSPEDKAHFRAKTAEAGALVIGSHTYATIGRALPGRRNIVLTSKPERITAEGIEATAESPAELVARLAKEGCKGLAVCGGSSVYAQFIQAGVVDEMFLTIEPILFGQGLTLLNEPVLASLNLVDVKKLNDNTVLLHYTVRTSEAV